MTAFSRLRHFSAPIASAVATAALLTGALWVQQAREAWPFTTKIHLNRFCASSPPRSATSDRSVDCRIA